MGIQDFIMCEPTSSLSSFTQYWKIKHVQGDEMSLWEYKIQLAVLVCCLKGIMEKDK